ncbi:hypothetical protein [Tengunoibacter tsumagoiensis]|uniref:DUF4352 domain-containing protein n=1 Tax=Tengunoibacter tsumagoiensis TaxID=2014871 RepID=A0A402A2M5_9CHLR|nr:hypothetical protein [Tengunoibacter tsumagoiensis]GCE13322.1 hypothetical protein KTT_31810 [Tengunoibacter tsumagoiensis]
MNEVDPTQTQNVAQKRPFFRKRWMGSALGVAIIILVTFLAVRYAPPEGEANNTTGDLPETPTVTVTNLLDQVNLKHEVDFQGVHITLSQAMLATHFSNDRKRAGTYTVRIMAQTKNNGSQAVGIDYAQLLDLILPDGSKVKSKYISIKAIQLPDSPQSGFFDFPVNEQVPLADLKLQFDEHTIVPLGEG